MTVACLLVPINEKDGIKSSFLGNRLVTHSCYSFNNTHAKISASSLAESTSINPKQCRKLKLSAKKMKLSAEN